MICGRVDDAPRLLEQVIPGDDPVGVTRLGLEAIVGTSGVEDLIAAAGSPSHCVRTTAVRWLGRCPHPLTVGPLLKGLADPNPETRLDVVNCLALFGSRESLLGVVSALHDPDRLVAGAAMHHIAQIMAEELDGLDLRYDEGDALDSDSADRLAPSPVTECAPSGQRERSEVRRSNRGPMWTFFIWGTYRGSFGCI